MKKLVIFVMVVLAFLIGGNNMDSRTKLLTDIAYSPDNTTTPRKDIDDSIKEVLDIAMKQVTVDRKLSETGNFTGSWYGITNPVYADPGLANVIANTLKNSSSLDVDPVLINQHFGALLGVGYMQETNNNLTQYAVTQACVKSSKIIYCANASTIFKNGQLICYTDATGEYYSNVVLSTSTTQINLVYPLQVSLDANCKVMFFYTDYSHCTKWGYYAIADYAIRDLQKASSKLIYRFLPSEYTAIGSNVAFSTSRLQNYTQPYGIFDTRVATITAANDGIRRQFKVKEAGNYRITTNINSVADDEIKLTITDFSGNEVTSKVLKNNIYASTEEFIINLDVGMYYIKMTSQKSSGNAYVYLGATEVFKLDKKYEYGQLNRGTHLLLGDSWFEKEGIFERLKERLPNANIINFGVGGNQVENLIRRWSGTATNADIKNDPVNFGDRKDATIIPKIDYTWIMCGGNDYYMNKSVSDYKSQMRTLIKAVVAKNSKPLIFNASVGDKFDTLGTGHQLYDLSQQYADFSVNANKDQEFFTEKSSPSGNTVSYVGGAGVTVLPNGQTFTMTLSTYSSVKLFLISTGGGQGALICADYASNSIIILANPSNLFEASSTPASGKIGIFKSANSHTISIKNNTVSTANLWISVFGSQVINITDPS